MAGPAAAGRQGFDVADIVRRHRPALEAEQHLSRAQRRVLSDIEQCRTAALGGHFELCRSCGHEHVHYHSCRNRHCPKCQSLAQERWIAVRTERLLPVGHFHVVFTLPSELRPLAHYRPREVYGALFAAASETLLELGSTRLGARLGITMVLHTWTRELTFHPHVHGIVSAGGLALDGSSWRPSSPQYLFPAKQVMSKLLRGKMICALRAAHARNSFDGFDDFQDPEGFERLISRLVATNWVVYAKEPFRKVDHVLAYLGRYTHRVAIANSRLVEVSDEAVTFRTKGDKTLTLLPVEFLRRFVQHVLPARFHKIRHYGLYAGAHARLGGLLERARGLLAPAPATTTAPPRAATSWQDLIRRVTGRDVTRCPRCGGPLRRYPVLPAASRAPPRRRAA